MFRTTLRRIGYGLFAMLVLLAHASQAEAVEGERFEVTSVKAPRAALVDTIAALQKGDVAGAKTAFENYDSLWNGIEMYINCSAGSDTSTERARVDLGWTPLCRDEFRNGAGFGFSASRQRKIFAGRETA